MRLVHRQREKPAANNIQPEAAAPINGHQAAPETPPDAIAAQAEPAPVAAAPQQPEPFPSDPSAALQRQLEEARKSQEMLAQRYAQLQAPQSREYAIALMVQGGASEAEANFFIDRPAMIENPKALLKAAAEAHEAGIERGTPKYFEYLDESFNRRMEKKQEKAARKAMSEPAPEFFQPAELPPQDESPKASIYSAPVSRETPSGSPRELQPSQVRLSPDELQIAKASGISPLEYAKQKLRMHRAQDAGIIQK
jgi:hypothetical protein